MHEMFTKNDWFKLSTYEQLAYIGCDVEKAIDMRKNGNLEQCDIIVKHAIELIELTVDDPKTQHRSREIGTIKLLLVDDFYGKNEYQSTDQSWVKYFGYFKHLVNAQKDNICRK
jgi:hypothetical protein